MLNSFHFFHVFFTGGKGFFSRLKQHHSFASNKPDDLSFSDYDIVSEAEIGQTRPSNATSSDAEKFDDVNVGGFVNTEEKTASNPIHISSDQTYESEDKMMKRGLMKVNRRICG